MSFSPRALNQVREEYDWLSWEEMYDYNAYWYEYLSDEQKAEYRSYMGRVEPMTDMDKNPQEHSMANLITA